MFKLVFLGYLEKQIRQNRFQRSGHSADVLGASGSTEETNV